MFEIKYSRNFINSLEKEINYWKNELGFSDEQIKKYISLISKNIQLLKNFPYISKDVSSIYEFHVSTYRITIGKKYAIFYRIDDINKIIMVGSLFNNRQMRIEF